MQGWPPRWIRVQTPDVLRRRSLPLVLSVFLAACGGSDPEDTAPDTTLSTSTTIAAAPTTTSTTTTTPPVSAPAPTTEVTSPSSSSPSPGSPDADLDDARAYADQGPHEVGVVTVELAKGPSVEIWYPAVEGSEGTETYDIREFVPEAIRALLTGDVAAGATVDARRDAELASREGGHPVVLFSHGFTGIRLQSSFLTSHLASWGFVVAAPDHPSRDLPGVLGATASGDRQDAVDDLLTTLDLLIELDAAPTGRFAGGLDLDRVAAVGHSAGGGTVLEAANDPRIDGYVSMASGNLNAGDFPDTPSFFLAGALDAVVDPETATRAAFESAAEPSRLWIIEGAGHNAFDDFCTFGDGTGVIGVAEASGLGFLLDAQPQLRTLGEDGCVPPAVDVTTTFPLIHHGVTAWLRHLVGWDPEPVGLGPVVSQAYEVAVEVAQRP